jgi:hypothetical protein
VTKPIDSRNKSTSHYLGDIVTSHSRVTHEYLEEDIEDESYGLVSGAKRDWLPDIERDAQTDRYAAHVHS